jgi:hypothetical protein
MPPRRSARVAAAAELRTCALAPLPLALAQHIFSLLPVDSRARASCVCCGWRTVLAEPALWTHLDLSDESGVAGALICDALLRGAAGRAHGRLHDLDVTGPRGTFSPHVLLEVLAANAGRLRELRVGELYTSRVADSGDLTLEAVRAAAPLLQALSAGNVLCSWEAAVHVIRGEPPWALLRFSALHVDFAERSLGRCQAASSTSLPSPLPWRTRRCSQRRRTSLSAGRTCSGQR